MEESAYYDDAKEEVMSILDDLYDNNLEIFDNCMRKFANIIENYLSENYSNLEFTFDNDISHSWSRGDFPSQYYTFTIYDKENDIEESVDIRFSDGHDNGRGGDNIADFNFLDSSNRNAKVDLSNGFYDFLDYFNIDDELLSEIDKIIDKINFKEYE